MSVSGLHSDKKLLTSNKKAELLLKKSSVFSVKKHPLSHRLNEAKAECG